MTETAVTPRVGKAAEPPLRIAGLVKRFSGVTALHGLNAEVHSGRLTGLVGPDGAGKTTLMRLAAGLLVPDEGSITVCGADTVREQARIAGLTGYMPQRFGLYEDLSVLENMRLYAALRGLPPAQRATVFERLLDFTRLAPFTGRLAGRLSGGMKQKLGLACALMARPQVLLLDEPGVGVDPVSRQELWRMVAELTGEGIAVVWSTAYLDEAERCDTVLLLNEGRLEYDGPPGALTGRLAERSFRLLPAQGDRRRLLAQALDLEAVSDGVIQGRAVRAVLRQGAAAASLQELASTAGAALEAVPPRFEDAFVDLLGGGPGGRSALAERMPEVRLESAPRPAEPAVPRGDPSSPAEPDLLRSAPRAGLSPARPPRGSSRPAKPDLLESPQVVQCEHLTRRFGDFTATDDVSFEVRQGEIFGLLGPNGAGKSTTFKMLCGLLKPTRGRAQVAGLDLAHAASAAKNRLGYMAQKFSLYGLLSVRQNLEFAAGVYGLAGAVKRERIDEMVTTFELARFLDAAPDALSLGHKQRLALACALMHRPPVLFLDEPTSGVDPITRREFWTHINGLVRKGVTVMVTTHFMDEAEYCDRVALMYRARLIALDTPDALKRRVEPTAAGEPTMEDAFIGLIRQVDAEEAAR